MAIFEGAARRRRAAELERRLPELDEWDRRYGLGGAPPGHPSLRPDTTWRHHSPEGRAPLRAFDPVPVHGGAHRAPRRPRRRGRAVLLLLSALVVAGTVAFPDEASTAKGWAAGAGRAILGLPPADPGTDLTTDPPVEARGEEPLAAAPAAPRWPDGVLDEVVQRWTPPQQSSFWGWHPPRGERVLPAVDPGPGGSFAFLQTQPGTEVPVGFSPCGSIPVEVNPAGAPWGYTDLVLASLDRLRAASGLDLVLVGETDDVWQEEAREFGSPVLISWSDPETVPALAGGYAGLGGATYGTGPDGWMWHASGQVVVDVTDVSTWEQHSSVLDHELAHVLGLDHVDDAGALMAARPQGWAVLGPGDLAGLAELGAIACPGG